MGFVTILPSKLLNKRWLVFVTTYVLYQIDPTLLAPENNDFAPTSLTSFISTIYTFYEYILSLFIPLYFCSFIGSTNSITLSLFLPIPESELNHINRISKMKKINILLRKCKSLSRLGRSSLYSSLRSKSVRDDLRGAHGMQEDEQCETIFVGRTRKQYVVSSKYLSHPILNALINKSKQQDSDENVLVVNCEVVLFDHLLWMLENADPNLSSDSLEELAELYGY